MVKPLNRVAGGLGAVALATGAILTMAPQAYAGKISPTVECTIPVLNTKFNGTQEITVDAPASGAAGSKVKIKVTLGTSPIKSPQSIGETQVTPAITFKLSTGGEATVTANAQQKINVQKDAPQNIAPYEGDLTIPASASGKLDLTPTTMVTKTQFGDTPCPIKSGGAVVASINVTAAASGGGAAASTTTTSTTSTTGDSLPKTGPLDDALSMGLVGGTVGLLGIGAVLVATRKVRNSRTTA